MAKVTKVAISLPKDVLEAIERKRKVKGESRSKFFQQAVRKFLEEEEQCSAIGDYIRGYQEAPESPEEIEAIDRLGSAVLAGEPWE